MAQESELIRDGWSLSPYSLVRSTGFPIELLDALNCSTTVAMLDAPEEVQSVEETFANELASLLTRLQLLIDRNDVREALFLSSPGAFAGLQVPSPGAHIRSNDRKRLKHLILYLQRLTTKCDTNSFFGPTWWGKIGQDQQLIDFAAPEYFSIARRHVLWTHWAVTAMAEAMSADPEVQGLLLFRPPPGLAIMGHSAWLTDFTLTPPTSRGPIALDAIELDLLTMCLQAPYGLHRSDLVGNDPNRGSTLDVLLAQLLLRSLIEIPSGLDRPLEWLVDYVQKSFPASARERWLSMLARLEEARRRYEMGNLEIRLHETAQMASLFETVSHRNAVRGEGTFYSDRSLLCEEDERNWECCDVGSPLLEPITDGILPVISVLLDVPFRRHRLRQLAAAAWFADTFPGEAEIPLPRMLAVADQDESLRQALAQVEEEIEPFSAELGCWLCQGDAGRRHVDIAPAMIRARAIEVDRLPCVVNLDLMIGANSAAAANGGDYYLVLGEVHTMQDLLVRNSSVVTHPDKEGATAASARQYARILPGITVAEPVMEHTDKTKVMLPPALLQIEFGGRAPYAASGSVGSSARVLRAGALSVRRNGDMLYLTAPGIDSILLTRTPVWSPFNRTSVLNIFALPHSNRLGGQVFQYPPGCMHFPRVTTARLVIHRETWWMDPRPAWKRETGYSLATWRILRKWRDEHAMPERVFVRFSDEPKPVFLDFRNPFLVNWFVRKIATANSPAQITECLPEVPDLWLHDAAGHYCCELRMTMYLDGRASKGRKTIKTMIAMTK